MFLNRICLNASRIAVSEMSLNQFMHPRNPYKKAPDFKELAAQYPEFNEHITIDEKGSFFNNTIRKYKNKPRKVECYGIITIINQHFQMFSRDSPKGVFYKLHCNPFVLEFNILARYNN